MLLKREVEAGRGVSGERFGLSSPSAWDNEKLKREEVGTLGMVRADVEVWLLGITVSISIMPEHLENLRI